jgi:hypothetical protein
MCNYDNIWIQMTFNVQIKPGGLDPDIFEYKGNYFKLTRTIEGRTKPLSDAELVLVKERLHKVFEAAVGEGIRLEDLISFDFNTANKHFYAYYDETKSPFDGSLADQVVRIKDEVVKTFLGSTKDSNSPKAPTKDQKKPVSTSSKTKPDLSAPSPSPIPSVENPNDLFKSGDDFKVKKNKVIQNLSNTREDISADALLTYLKHLENSYYDTRNKVITLDQASIQDKNKFFEHPKVKEAIRLFNKNKNLKTIYLPIHVGSSKGRQTGHWIVAALTRKYSRLFPIAVVYDPLGSNRFTKKLANYLSYEINGKPIRQDSKHQRDGINCGIHVLHFVKIMEKHNFTKLDDYMKRRKIKVDCYKARKNFIEDYSKNAKEADFKRTHEIALLDDILQNHLGKDNEFVGSYQIKKLHKAQLEVFKISGPEDIRKAHFDWWTFPIEKTSNRYGYKYKLNDIACQELLGDDEFMKYYIESTWCVLDAYGFTLSGSKENGYKITPKDTTHENEFNEIRIKKMAESFYHFNIELYKAFINVEQIKRLVTHQETKDAFNLST